MRKQQQIWKQEHEKESALPGIGLKQDPSSFVKAFIFYLKEKSIFPPLKVVDIGSGKGRNTIYLANEGFEVYAMDYISQAIKEVTKLAHEYSLQEKIHATTAAIDEQWEFSDNFFDLAIDCFSSIDIETEEGRVICRDEMLRTLRPGGYAMVSVVSVNDEFESELMKAHPGKEKNSVIWPANEKFQKNYDIKELREFFNPFAILKLEEITRPGYKLGKKYNATNLFLIMQKPKNEN